MPTISAEELVQQLHCSRLIHSDQKKIIAQQLQSHHNSGTIIASLYNLLSANVFDTLVFATIFNEYLEEYRSIDDLTSLTATLCKLTHILKGNEWLSKDYIDTLLQTILESNPVEKIQLFEVLIDLHNLVNIPLRLKNYTSDLVRANELHKYKNSAPLLFQADFEENTLALIQYIKPSAIPLDLLNALSMAVDNEVLTPLLRRRLQLSKAPSEMIKALLKFPSLLRSNLTNPYFFERLAAQSEYQRFRSVSEYELCLRTLHKLFISQTIPSKYKKLYSGVLLSAASPVFSERILAFFRRLHISKFTSPLSELDINRICKFLSTNEGKYLSCSQLVTALARLDEKLPKIQEPLREQVIYWLCNTKTPGKVITALCKLDKANLLNKPELSEKFIHVNDIVCFSNAILDLEKKPEIRDHLVSAFSRKKSLFNLSEVEFFQFKEIFFYDESIYNLSYEDSKSIFFTNEKIDTLLTVLKQYPNLYDKISQNCFYMYINKISQQTASISPLIDTIFDLLKNNLLPDDTLFLFFEYLIMPDVANHVPILVPLFQKHNLLDTIEDFLNVINPFILAGKLKTLASCIETLESIAVKAPSFSVKQKLLELLTRPDATYLAFLIPLYTELLHTDPEFWINRIFHFTYGEGSTDENNHYEQMKLQASFLNMIKAPPLWNETNRQRIFNTDLSSIFWVTSFFSSQNLFDFIFDSSCSNDLKEKPYLLISLHYPYINIPAFLEQIDVNIINNNRIYSTIRHRLPWHALRNNLFWTNLTQVFEQTRADAEEVRIHRIELFLVHYLNNIYERQFTTRATGEINHSQSVHNQYVEHTAFESANRLKQNYQGNTPFEVIKNDLLNYLESSTLEVIVIEAVKRCLHSFEHFKYTNSLSQLTTRSLLQHCWEAIHDEARLRPNITLDEAKKGLIHGLYLMQRSYNLDNNDHDNGSNQDLTSCQAGAFILLVSSLYTFHQDVEIQFISLKLAGFRLNVLVKSHVATYLASQKKNLTAVEFKDLVSTMETEGISSIWDNISSPIQSEVMSEFGQLFNNNKNNRQFIELLSVYQDVDLDAVFEKYRQTEPLSTPTASCISEDNTSNSSPLGFFSGQKRNRDETNDQPEELVDLKHRRG